MQFNLPTAVAAAAAATVAAVEVPEAAVEVVAIAVVVAVADLLPLPLLPSHLGLRELPHELEESRDLEDLSPEGQVGSGVRAHNPEIWWPTTRRKVLHACTQAQARIYV